MARRQKSGAVASREDPLGAGALGYTVAAHSVVVLLGR
jgi:hypothetical protein